MDTGFGSWKPWSPSYSPTAEFILSKSKNPAQVSCRVPVDAYLESVSTKLPIQGPSSKGPRGPKVQKSEDLVTCEQSRRAIAAPPTAQPAAAPTPRPTAEAQIADTQAAARAAVDRRPEEDITSVTILILLPVFGYQVDVLIEGVQDIRVGHGLARQLFTKLVALKGFALYLPLGQMQNDLPLFENGPAFADVGLDFGASERQIWGSGEVDGDCGWVEGDHTGGILRLLRITAIDCRREETDGLSCILDSPLTIVGGHTLESYLVLDYRTSQLGDLLFGHFFLSFRFYSFAVGFSSAFALPQQRMAYIKPLSAMAS